jgi:hypothetical protein
MQLILDEETERASETSCFSLCVTSTSETYSREVITICMSSVVSYPELFHEFRLSSALEFDITLSSEFNFAFCKSDIIPDLDRIQIELLRLSAKHKFKKNILGPTKPENIYFLIIYNFLFQTFSIL